MSAKEIQSISTLSSRVTCFFYVHQTVAHALFYNNQLQWLVLNFNLFIIRVRLHENEGKSKNFDCAKRSKMFLSRRQNSCLCLYFITTNETDSINFNLFMIRVLFRKSKGNQNVLTVYNDQLNWVTLNCNLFILRMHLHESKGKSGWFDCQVE